MGDRECAVRAEGGSGRRTHLNRFGHVLSDGFPPLLGEASECEGNDPGQAVSLRGFLIPL